MDLHKDSSSSFVSLFFHSSNSPFYPFIPWQSPIAWWLEGSIVIDVHCHYARSICYCNSWRTESFETFICGQQFVHLEFPVEKVKNKTATRSLSEEKLEFYQKFYYFFFLLFSFYCYNCPHVFYYITTSYYFVLGFTWMSSTNIVECSAKYWKISSKAFQYSEITVN